MLTVYTRGEESRNSLPAPLTPADTTHIKQAGDFRLLSYNVRHCEGMDNQVDYDRIASIINDLDVDIVCLQELDKNTTRTGQVDQISILAEKTGMTACFAKAIDYEGGEYGVGILTKEIPLATSQYPLPGKEPRTVLIAEFADYVVASTHLDLQGDTRLEDAKIVTEKVKALGKKAYLAGDFNEKDRTGAVFQVLDKDWTVVSSPAKTFPTGTPRTCIDYVLTLNTGDNYQVSNTSVVYSLPKVNVATASDHYPIYTDFNIYYDVPNKTITYRQ
ncbi:hypothetical protein FACS1894176_06970 [Bacteroidia bacterium]|nr:hypothetical protein FACS1894176_06970 [Bacteroidia bacterium]